MVLFIALIASLAAGPPEREVIFKNGAVVLSGSVLLPAGNAPFAAVALLHGSGPQARDSLLPIARRLTEAGAAALVFDKRGTGRSTGTWTSASLEELSGDAIQAVRALASQPEVQGKPIGVFAISQSGWYAPLVALREPAVRFLAVVTGGGATPREVEWFGYERKLRQRGVVGDDLAKAHRVLGSYFDYLATGEGRSYLSRALEDGKGSPWAEALQLDRVLPGTEARPNWAWVATFDPAPSIEKLRIPVLLFFGGRDDLLPTEISLQRWTEALGRSEARVTVRLFAEAGHGMTLGPHHGEHSGEQQYAVGYFEMLAAWLHDIARHP